LRTTLTIFAGFVCALIGALVGGLAGNDGEKSSFILGFFFFLLAGFLGVFGTLRLTRPAPVLDTVGEECQASPTVS